MALSYILDLNFTEQTWLKITIDDGTAAEYTFSAGESKTWQAEKTIDLHLGNAGGAKISLNGKPMHLREESGQTVRIKIP